MTLLRTLMNPYGQEVYVAYADQDKKFGLQLARDLRKQGIAAVLSRRLRPPITLEREIANQVKFLSAGSYLLVFVFSPAGLQESVGLMTLLTNALRAGKGLFPVLYQDCELPELRNVPYVDFRGEYALAFEELLTRVRAELALR